MGKFLWFCFKNNPRFHTQAAAKSLQSCPTLCDPIDSSPPGSPVPGGTQKNCSGSSELDQGGVQCAERALGGTGELSAEIVEKGGQSESRIALERTGNLTGNQ